VDGKRYFHRVSEEQIEGATDLIAWLQSESGDIKFYWKDREGEEVAAVGSVLSFSGPPRFDEGNDSEARFYGGHAFFPDVPFKDGIWKAFPSQFFFLPEKEVRRSGGKTTFLFHQLNGSSPAPAFCPPILPDSSFVISKGAHTPSKDVWKTLVEKIQSEQLDKVVLARRSTYSAKGDPLSLLSSLPQKGGILFAIQIREGATFLGVTPERLYRRVGRTIETEAVAGTRKLGTDPRELLDDPKERQEFLFVKESIQTALSPLCEEVSFDKEDQILQTPNVIHLYNCFSAELCRGVTDAEILEALHPTAAMGGTPRLSALEYLARHEPFERGWYASPIGYLSARSAEFAVGIRSALVEGEHLHLFAGAGIVEGSAAENEWTELENKVSLWKNLALHS
jgi:menaquinone-specific isochorismate synthase